MSIVGILGYLALIIMVPLILFFIISSLMGGSYGIAHLTVKTAHIA